MPFDYDDSFRGDREADKDPEDALEPIDNKSMVRNIIYRFIDEIWMGGDSKLMQLSDELNDLLKPYIKDN